MAAVGRQRSGKGSRIAVGGTPLNLGKYEADYKGDDLDTTNFESGGAEQGTIGIIVVDFSFGGLFDAHVPPYRTPPGIYPRDDLANVQFFTNVADNNFWLMTTSRILSAKNGSEVRGLVTFDATGKSNGGGVTIPTTAV